MGRRERRAQRHASRAVSFPGNSDVLGVVSPSNASSGGYRSRQARYSTISVSVTYKAQRRFSLRPAPRLAASLASRRRRASSSASSSSLISTRAASRARTDPPRGAAAESAQRSNTTEKKVCEETGFFSWSRGGTEDWGHYAPRPGRTRAPAPGVPWWTPPSALRAAPASAEARRVRPQSSRSPPPTHPASASGRVARRWW